MYDDDLVLAEWCVEMRKFQLCRLWIMMMDWWWSLQFGVIFVSLQFFRTTNLIAIGLGSIQLFQLVPIQFWVALNWFSWCQFKFRCHPNGSASANVILDGTQMVWSVLITFLMSLNRFSRWWFNFVWQLIGSVGTTLILVAPNWFSWCLVDFGCRSIGSVGADLILDGIRLVQLVPN